MERNDVEQLVAYGIFPYEQEAEACLIETAISYIILKGSYAYKIKKNIKLSFLDFSTLERRRHFCYEELRLNKRLAKETYFQIVSIAKKGTQWAVSTADSQAKEYAVLMKAMNRDHQLSELLKKHTIHKKTIRQLALQLAGFHLREKPLTLSYDPFFLSREFADISTFIPEVQKRLGTDYVTLIQTSIALSNHFVFLYQKFIAGRVAQGYFKNCHGDLHSQNIFIEKQPVIFDCIEFREAFRHIDILNEIAFLCMDLEIYGYKNLAKLFLQDYIKQTGYAFGKKERILFTYFKAYRACIRAKVHTIELSQHPSDRKIKKKAKTYLETMANYLIEIADVL